jgi:hypothetical protein
MVPNIHRIGKTQMKLFIPVVFAAIALAGCVMAPTKSSISGLFASNPVREDPSHFQWADGKDRVVTTDLTLRLSPDGSFSTWSRMYFDGEVVRFSGLAAYDLQTNSKGSWRIADGKLILRSMGPTYFVTDMMWQQTGKTMVPEESQADLIRRNGQWHIVWKNVEYTLQQTPPPHAPEPTTLGITLPPPRKPWWRFW